MNLFLDDIRKPSDVLIYANTLPQVIDKELFADNDAWVVVKDFDEFKAFIDGINLRDIERISFDHDLAPEHYTPEKYWDNYELSKEYQESQNYQEKTGYDCMVYFVNKCIKERVSLVNIPLVTVHSANLVGRDKIQNHFNDFVNSRKIVEHYGL